MKSGEQVLVEAVVATGGKARPPRKEPKESRVLAADVQDALREALYPTKPGRFPVEVEVIAQRAGVSPRTIYRYANASLPLDTADRLLLAVDKSVRDVRVIER